MPNVNFGQDLQDVTGNAVPILLILSLWREATYGPTG
jgi:hypothetical protein